MTNDGHKLSAFAFGPSSVFRTTSVAQL